MWASWLAFISMTLHACYLGRRFVLSLTVSLALFACSPPVTPRPPSAVAGELDARKWNPERQGNISLDGEWEFYWNQLLAPGDFSSSHPLPHSLPCLRYGMA